LTNCCTATATSSPSRFFSGDTGVYFGVQSCMKPLNYAIALETRGYDKVFEHIGIEPSGHSFNEMVLDHRRVADGTGNTGLPVVLVWHWCLLFVPPACADLLLLLLPLLPLLPLLLLLVRGGCGLFGADPLPLSSTTHHPTAQAWPCPTTH
jgi:hypothetical protein